MKPERVTESNRHCLSARFGASADKRFLNIMTCIGHHLHLSDDREHVCISIPTTAKAARLFSAHDEQESARCKCSNGRASRRRSKRSGFHRYLKAASVQPLATVFSVTGLMRVFTRDNSWIWFKSVSSGNSLRAYDSQPSRGDWILRINNDSTDRIIYSSRT